MRYYFVNKYFYPDLSATSQKLTELTDDLELKEMHVVTNRYLYRAEGKLDKVEEHNGVIIHRIPSLRSADNLLSKVLSALTFYISLLVFLVVNLRKGDVLIAKTDPPMLSLILLPVMKIKSIRMVNWLQDIFPEIAMRLDYPFLKGFFAKALISLRNYSLNHADRNVVVSEDMRKYLVESGVKPEKISVVHNWCSDAIKKIGRKNKAFNFPEHKKIIMYAGNMGRAHEFYEFGKLICEVSRQDEFCVVFIGGGVGFSYLKKMTNEKALKNIIFTDYVDGSQLNELLNAADIHLISMRKGFQDCLMPSKLYCILNVRKPIMFIGDVSSSLANLIAQYDLGLAIAEVDRETIIDKLRITAEKTQTDDLTSLFNMKKSVDMWQDILEDTAR